jgi:hypothetical protein
MPRPTILCPHCNVSIRNVRYSCICVEYGKVPINASLGSIITEDWDYLDIDSHEDHDQYNYSCPSCGRSVILSNLIIVPADNVMNMPDIVNRRPDTTAITPNTGGVWHCQ